MQFTFNLVLIILFKIILTQQEISNLDFNYHNYDKFTSILKNYSQWYPTKTYLYSIGQSVQGRELWVLAIADTKPSEHILLRPEAKYIGNMHGNEVPSKEVLLHLIDYLLNNQNTGPNVDYLLKNTRIHIMVSMNPDGYEQSYVGDCYSIQGRLNKNGYDLNRNFPDLFSCNTDPMQIETKHVLNWLNSNSFVLSANLHGGTIVANYPYDNYDPSKQGVSSNPTDYNDVFETLALNYSLAHATMRNSPCNDETFTNGITNGAQWYSVEGGMQDLNFWGFGCFEITLEISCCKFPTPDQLSTNWQENKNALISYLKLANTGVKGIVTYANGKPASYLIIGIDEREPLFKTNANGEYYRILRPGTYNLTIRFDCSTIIYTTTFQIISSQMSLVLNITLLDSSLYKKSLSYKQNSFSVFCKKTVPSCLNSALYSLSFSDSNLSAAGTINLFNQSNMLYLYLFLFYFGLSLSCLNYSLIIF